MAPGPHFPFSIRAASAVRRTCVLSCALLAWAGLAACSDHSSPPQAYDASRVRRVFEPPPGGVRAVPPHAIRSEGVGPYLLKAPLKDVLELLPRGPRVVLMEIDRVVDYSLVEAEGGSLLIGVQRPGVSFVTVLDKEIARTENDVGVGTGVKDLRNVMGPETRAPNLLRDPRILVFDHLPNARFVIQDKAVAAILVGDYDVPRNGGSLTGTAESGAEGSQADAGVAGKAVAPHCQPIDVTEQKEALLRAARLEKSDGPAQVVPGCFAGGAVALVFTNGRLVAITGEPGKLRRGAAQAIPDLTFAGPIDVDGDGRAEIGVVTHSVEEGVLTVSVEVLRLEGSRLQRLAARDAYRVSAVSATWIGARLDQIDLLLDMSARFETLELGGLYVQRSGERVRNVAPLHPVKLALRPKRPSSPSPPSSAAGVGPADAGAKAGKAPPKARPDAGAARAPAAERPSGRTP